MKSAPHRVFMKAAIDLAMQGVDSDQGGPFGAVVVKDGQIVGQGNNRVTSTNDPTAHAEVVAIREACRRLDTFQLDNCVIYTSCEPCPMCLGAIYWARIGELYYGCSQADAAQISFDDQYIYDEIALPEEDRKIKFKRLMREEALEAFKKWSAKENKTPY